MPKFARLCDRDPVMVQLAQQVAARLIGFMGETPETILEKLDAPGGVELDDSFCDELDRLVFCCGGCEHYFAQIENAHPGYDHDKPWMCMECAREEAA